MYISIYIKDEITWPFSDCIKQKTFSTVSAAVPICSYTQFNEYIEYIFSLSVTIPVNCNVGNDL